MYISLDIDIYFISSFHDYQQGCADLGPIALSQEGRRQEQITFKNLTKNMQGRVHLVAKHQD